MENQITLGDGWNKLFGIYRYEVPGSFRIDTANLYSWRDCEIDMSSYRGIYWEYLISMDLQS